MRKNNRSTPKFKEHSRPRHSYFMEEDATSLCIRGNWVPNEQIFGKLGRQGESHEHAFFGPTSPVPT
jgi:hypothetical protein